MTVSLGTAYRSFGGEVEASNTPTICRLHRFMPSPTLGHSSTLRSPDLCLAATASQSTRASRNVLACAAPELTTVSTVAGSLAVLTCFPLTFGDLHSHVGTLCL